MVLRDASASKNGDFILEIGDCIFYFSLYLSYWHLNQQGKWYGGSSEAEKKKEDVKSHQYGKILLDNESDEKWPVGELHFWKLKWLKVISAWDILFGKWEW